MEIHLVMDNYATHKTPSVRRWLKKHPEYVVHFTPTSASWPNMVERFFAKTTTRRLRRGVFRSVHALRQAIMDYLDEHNQNPKPFTWTDDADLILNRVSNKVHPASAYLHEEIRLLIWHDKLSLDLKSDEIAGLS